jgi:ribosomal protein L11 methylase PrmA
MQGVKDAMKDSQFQVPAGSHATNDEAIFNIAKLIDVGHSEVLWDIGVGSPKLAFFFSMLTAIPVIGTDIGKEFNDISLRKVNN